MDPLNSAAVVAKRCSRAKAFGRRSAAASSSSEPLIQNYSNFKRSSRPERLMYYDDGSWVDYSEEVADLLKLGFAEKKPVVEAQILSLNRLFDFYRMLEIDLESGNQRSIAWIDVDGKCFFPKTFVDSCGNDREVELVDGDEGDNTKFGENLVNRADVGLIKDVNLGKRGRNQNLAKEEVDESCCATPAKKPKMVENESQSSRWPKARIMATEEKGYAIVKNLFQSRLDIVEPGATITSIHQCVRTGPMEKARSEVFAKQMEITKRVRGESNMVFAWYGTSAKGVDSILMHGFGIPSKASRSPRYGVGIHLSPIRSPETSSILSDVDENGEKHVILCRVILGKCEKIDAGSRQLYPSSVEYDSGVDDLNNPRWYTVWHSNMNTHIMPDCVVSYRPVNTKGSVNGVPKNSIPHPSTFIVMLFSKLRGSLPSPRLCELQTSWESCKEGKLGKDAFMEKLRSLVGDDMLRSAIQEIRG